MIGYSDGRVYEDEMHAHLDIPAMPSDKEPEQDPNVEQQKKIYFVRHGETDANEDNRCRGWGSFGLNDDGRKDAQKAADSLDGSPVEHLVASDLERAKQTARVISSRLGGIPIEYNPGLRTWDTGDWTGQKNSDVEPLIKQYTNNTPDLRPPGSSESFNEFKDRVLSTVSDIMKKHSDKEVGVVSHSMVGGILHGYEQAGQPNRAESLWDWLFGGQQKAKAALPPPDKGMPTDKESDEARDVNLQYGDPSARYVTPGLASSKTMEGVTFDLVTKLRRQADQERYMRELPKSHPIDLAKADEFNKAWLASRRSALSQLGFSLPDTYQSPHPEEDKQGLNVAGLTSHMTKAMWSNPAYPMNIIHESMHRGVMMMKDAGLIDKDYDDELLVRRMMDKHFGPESSQGTAGKALLEQSKRKITDVDMDKYEKMAAEFLAKKRPGGPR